MKLRMTKNPEITGVGNKFNTHDLFEVIVYFDEGDCDSCFGRELDVQLSDGKWVSLSQAFRDKLVINDNYNIEFREPKNQEEIDRGFYY